MSPRSPAVVGLSERVTEMPPAGAGSRRPAERERMAAGSANGLLVHAACTKAERRKERGGHSATAPTRFELWSAIVTPKHGRAGRAESSREVPRQSGVDGNHQENTAEAAQEVIGAGV
jgi:hypothetical protein